MKKLTILLCILALVGFSLIGCGEQKKSYTYNTIGGGTATAPGVTGVTPATVAPGQQITIAGTNFGATRSLREADKSYVNFEPTDGGTAVSAAIYASWSDGQIICTVPELPTNRRRAVSYVVVVYVVSGSGTYFSSPTSGGGNSITAVPSNTIIGAISDALLGTGISGATVTAGGQNTTTDPNGFYMLTNVPAGPQTVTANKTGYEENTTDVVVAPQAAVTGNIPLTSTVSPCGIGFIGPDTYSVGGETYSVASGDFNRDEILDLAVANAGNNTVDIYLGNGDGTFQFNGSYNDPAGSPNEIVVGDFDLQNGPDVAVTHWGNGVTVFLNQGDGTFGNIQSYDMGGNPRKLAAADLNDDGYPDIVTPAAWWGGPLYLLKNRADGTGTFENATDIGGTREGGEGVALVDVNNDGLPDVIWTTNYSDYTVNVKFNQGNFSFSAAQSYNLGSSGRDITLADFDKGNGPDIAVTGNNGMFIMKNNGDGTFGAGQYYPTGNEAYGIATADFNDDSYPDLAVANFGAGTVSVYFNDGEGAFTLEAGDFTLSNNYASGYSCKSLAIGDFDRQNGPDFASANQYADNFTVFINDGSGLFPLVAIYTVGDEPRGAAIGDLNGDGNPDLVVPNSSSDSISVLMSKGDGTFDPAVYYLGGPGPYSASIADFDGDGKPDIAIANAGVNKSRDTYGSVSIFINYGNGTFKPRLDYAAGNTPRWISAGDLNGDMIPDLAVANWDSDNVSILLNKGDGTFFGAVNYPVQDQPSAVEIGDLDGDGYQDLTVSNYGENNSMSVLFNNGDGTFGTPQSYAAGSDPSGIAIGDVDNDGFFDVAVTDSNNNQLLIFINNRDGTFEFDGSYEAGGGCRAPSMGDINCDGYLDIAVANESDNYISVFVNNQDGTFGESVDFGLGNSPMAAVIGDLNNDRMPDMSIPSRGSDGVIVLIHKEQTPP
ncbi:MAG: FG-GAP-like repeat-containing protein [Chloroflexi bacterium]|nr:FG-GAP-like repeat-containing protein [Chloroflexota bacterium]